MIQLAASFAGSLVVLLVDLFGCHEEPTPGNNAGRGRGAPRIYRTVKLLA